MADKIIDSHIYIRDVQGPERNGNVRKLLERNGFPGTERPTTGNVPAKPGTAGNHGTAGPERLERHGWNGTAGTAGPERWRKSWNGRTGGLKKLLF